MGSDCSSSVSLSHKLYRKIGRKTYYELNSLFPTRNQFKYQIVFSIQD